MDYLQINRRAWDARTPVHVGSAFYDVPGFLSGATSLREIERRELSDVQGRSLLHLQCHFGLDTLSWAREGARVTGVDLSPVAIEQARSLAEKSNLSASFICDDAIAYLEGCETQYHVVFTSYGAVCWLPDLRRWAAGVARCMASGGRFYMAEFHPVYDLIAGYSYFHKDEPDVEEETTYTENGEAASTTVAVWSHPLADVLTALIEAGLRIEQVHEFPFSPYDCFKGLVERERGRFFLTHQGNDVPLVYSVLASKP